MGLSSYALADLLGLSLSAIENYRRAVQPPHRRLWRMLDERMGLNPAEFIDTDRQTTSLSEALDEAMRKQGLQVNDVATHLNASVHTVHDWLRAGSGISDKFITPLENLLDVDLSPFKEMSLRQVRTQARLEVKVVEHLHGRVHWNTYENTNTLCKFSCSVPEHPSFWRIPDSVIHSKTWCPLCSQTGQLRSSLQFHQEVADKGGTPLSEYISSKEKVLVECGRKHKFWCSPHDLHLKGIWCPWCKSLNRSHHGFMGVKKAGRQFIAKIGTEMISRHPTAEEAARARDTEVINRGLHEPPYYYPLNLGGD